jgi:hypothetical protein
MSRAEDAVHGVAVLPMRCAMHRPGVTGWHCGKCSASMLLARCAIEKGYRNSF